MIVKGKNVGRASNAISVNGKVFADLINDIENDLESWSTDFLFYVNQKEAARYCNEIKQKLVELKKLIK